MEPIENLPFSCRFQQNTSYTCDSWIISNRSRRAFQSTRRGPTKSRLNDTFGGEVSITVAIVSFLCRAILELLGYTGAPIQHRSGTDYVSEHDVPELLIPS